MLIFHTKLIQSSNFAHNIVFLDDEIHEKRHRLVTKKVFIETTTLQTSTLTSQLLIQQDEASKLINLEKSREYILDYLTKFDTYIAELAYLCFFIIVLVFIGTSSLIFYYLTNSKTIKNNDSLYGTK
jgi:hypothetical protein